MRVFLREFILREADALLFSLHETDSTSGIERGGRRRGGNGSLRCFKMMMMIIGNNIGNDLCWLGNEDESVSGLTGESNGCSIGGDKCMEPNRPSFSRFCVRRRQRTACARRYFARNK